jgi:hypothetical protein
MLARACFHSIAVRVELVFLCSILKFRQPYIDERNLHPLIIPFYLLVTRS